MIDDALTWKNHIHLLAKKLSKACYVIRNVKPYMSIIALKAIYYYFFFQKKAIRIILGHGNRVSCRNLFGKLGILTLASQYILSLIMFVVQNKTLFPTNCDSHAVVTRQRQTLYLPQANLTIYQRGVNYAGVKIFNKLPIEIRNTPSNLNKFKAMLKHFLITHSLYTVEEYLNVTH
jgi:hypothetical protein